MLHNIFCEVSKKNSSILRAKNKKCEDRPFEKLPFLFDFKESFLCYIKNPSNESQLLKEPRLIKLNALFFSFKFKESFHCYITHFWVLCISLVFSKIGVDTIFFSFRLFLLHFSLLSLFLEPQGDIITKGDTIKPRDNL